MIIYHKLAIIEAKPGVICFKTFQEPRALYRLEILPDGNKRIWKLYKYPSSSVLEMDQRPNLVTANASKKDLLGILPKGWTVPEFFIAAVFFQAGMESKETGQNT